MPFEEPLAQPRMAEEYTEGVSLHGLMSAEVQAARAQYGPNEVPQARQGAVRALLWKFWAPVPWMLEATIVLQLARGKAAEAVVITVLLVVNALVSFVQEHRANQALALVQRRLAVRARVLRDGRWQRVPAQELVPGDVVHVRMGDLAPADIRVLDGQILFDQAALTGESLPVEAGVGATAYAGTTVTRGEAMGTVTATGQHTIVARVFPEDKFHLVQALQRAGHVVGITGDGVNDAPALQQAEVGIAVANATDVAKAAASLVLTTPGLRDVLAAVETSRRIYQRMLTYTLNKIIKTIEIAVFLSLGVMLTGVLVITPLLIVLLLFTNDFVTMAIATDRVPFVRTPERWRIPTLLLTAGTLAVPLLLLSFSVFVVGRDLLHLPLAQLQTLIFVLLVFTGQGNVYLVRERRHCWQSLPSCWLFLSSVLDVVIVSVLATHGILMAAISPALVAGVFGVGLAFLMVVDVLKIRLLRYFDLS